MKLKLTHSDLHHNGVHYKQGSEVDLDDGAAQRLIDLKVAEPVASPPEVSDGAESPPAKPSKGAKSGTPKEGA